ncbi:hypothetical protein ACHAPO_004161 [Fusarium lateritium]
MDTKFFPFITPQNFTFHTLPKSPTMNLRNGKETGHLRPKTPKALRIPKTPENPLSEDSVAPLVKDDVPEEKDTRYLEDIVAENVTYPVCRALWKFILSPLWQWIIRPTLWEYILRPVLWERILRQGLWEGFSRRIIFDGVLKQILFHGLVQSFLGERVFLPLYQMCEVLVFPLVQRIFETVVYPLYRQLVQKLPASARRKVKSILSPIYRELEDISGPFREMVWDPILYPLVGQIRPEELLSFLFVLRISTNITFASDQAYLSRWGYRPDTEDFSKRSITEFGQIPFQDKYSWCWLLQWILWILWA